VKIFIRNQASLHLIKKSIQSFLQMANLFINSFYIITIFIIVDSGS